MNQKIAVVNPKGGVGKTTTVVNLAAFFTALGKNSLIIDLDPQASATRNFGFSISGGELKRKKLTYLIKKTNILGCDLLSLGNYQINSANTLKNLFPAPSRIPYNFILMDCPPDLGRLTQNALNLANRVLIPVQCDYFALEGLDRLVKNINQKNLHIILTMFDPRNKLAHQVVKKIQRKYKSKVFQTIIPRNVKLAEAPQKKKTILQYAPSSPGARAYKKLSTEILQKRK